MSHLVQQIRTLGFCLISSLTVFAGALAAQTQTFDYPPTISLEDVQKWVDRAPVEHPRLLASKAELEGLADSVKSDPARRALAAAVVKEAELLQDISPVVHELEGRRLLDQSRRCVKRVVVLATAYYLTGQEQHARRCEKEMLAAARFSDWNPSHFLDVGEMTFALAIGYDWLYDRLGEPARSEIRKAIVEKGVSLPFETRYNGWVRARNNWGQVCHGGLTAGALAVLEDERELAAKTVHNALHNVTYSMKAYEPKGSYPEGPGYWSYGTSYNVLLIAALESALGSDFGLTKAPGFSQTGQYVSLVCGPSGEFFNYADGGSGRGPESVLFWFADRYHHPDWLLGERQRIIGSVSSVDRGDAASSRHRLLPFALLWMTNGQDHPEIHMPLYWFSEGETPITVFRSSWTDPNATFVGLKAGSPSASHGQMDIGSFVLDAQQVRWAKDLGAEGYYGIESRGMNLWGRNQDSDRWTIFRQSNEGHNTLVIDGKLQKASGNAPIVEFSDDPSFPHSIADMSEVYEGQAATVRRGVAMIDSRDVLIQDELTGLKPGSRVRWGMITPGSPGMTGARVIDLSQGKAALKMTILTPGDVAWTTIDTARPRHEWDSPNRGTRMIAFEAIAPESGELTLAVLAQPGKDADSAAATRQVIPLVKWDK